MSGELRVITGYVQELAELQGRTAQQILSALEAAQGVGTSMWKNHGMVCAPSNSAVIAAETARRAACTRMNAKSEELAQKLDMARKLYDGTDMQEEQKLDDEMRCTPSG